MKTKKYIREDIGGGMSREIEFKEKHTPTPWKIENGSAYANAGTIDISKGTQIIAAVLVDIKPGNYFQKDILKLASAQEKANAELIVRAVNSHEILLKALKLAKHCLKENRGPSLNEFQQIQAAITQAEVAL